MVQQQIRYGIDVGQRRIGVAKAMPASMLAVPVATIYRDDYDPGFDELEDIVDADGAEPCFIVGYPCLMSGKPGKQARDVLQWARELRKRFPSSSIRLVDERMSSASAHRDLSQAGRKTSEHRAVVDQQAAVIILQHSIDIEQQTGTAAGQPLGRLVTDEGSNG